jgi:hypothetical protein
MKRKCKLMPYLRDGILLLVVLFSLGCASARVNIAEYGVLDIDSKQSSFKLPDYIINKKRPKIAVLPPSDNTQYKSCNLSAVAQEYLSQTLGGIAELAERSQLNAIMQELKFTAGLTGDVDLEKFAKLGREIDFVFVGSVVSAHIEARFREARRERMGKDVYYSPPSCSEEVRVGITWRIMDLSSLTTKKAFTMEGRVSTLSREVRSSSECKVIEPCGLLSQAVRRAVDNSEEDIMREFPVYGYIYKTMTKKNDPSKRIAFLNVGSNDGIKAGSRLEIVSFIEEKDPIKGITTLRSQVVGYCTISETDLQADKSICMISEESADQVFVGHAIRLKIEEGFFRKLQKIMSR